MRFHHQVLDMKIYNFPFVALFLTLLLFPSNSLAQEQQRKDALEREGNSIEWFKEEAANNREPLLVKALQFTAPYQGFYQRLSLDNEGNAFTAQIVPNWAIQGSVGARLDETSLARIKQALGQLSITQAATSASPQPGQLYTAFVFYDGKGYVRCDFSGPLPQQVQELLDLLEAELTKAAKIQHEEFLKHQQLMEQLYGDWRNRSGVSVITGDRMSALRNAQALLLTIMGSKKPVTPMDAKDVSIYHALIFYPEGALTGSGGGGSWSDDPLSTQAVIWDVRKGNGKGNEKPDKKRLEIKYQAIEGSISIDGKTYRLADGNLFVIRINGNWTPLVTQIQDRLDERATERKVLERFKTDLPDDESVERLELN
jgi:hypothetical protein